MNSFVTNRKFRLKALSFLTVLLLFQSSAQAFSWDCARNIISQKFTLLKSYIPFEKVSKSTAIKVLLGAVAVALGYYTFSAYKNKKSKNDRRSSENNNQKIACGAFISRIYNDFDSLRNNITNVLNHGGTIDQDSVANFLSLINDQRNALNGTLNSVENDLRIKLNGISIVLGRLLPAIKKYNGIINSISAESLEPSKVNIARCLNEIKTILEEFDKSSEENK